MMDGTAPAIREVNRGGWGERAIRVSGLSRNVVGVGRPRRYTDEILSAAVAGSDSMAGVLRYLGLAQAGGTHAHVSRRIREYEIDTSHFVRSRGGVRKPLDVAAILTPIPFGSPRRKPEQLRRALLALGVAPRCQVCGVGRVWRGVALTLHVDHIDGDFHNNRADNLRFLCPNCHSQTSTYAGRQKGRYGSPSERGTTKAG